MAKQLLFVVLAVLFAQSALAQQFYKWKDQKGQWHYSDFPPSGVTAEKLGTGDTPQTLEVQPSVSSTGEQRKTEDSSGRSTQGASDVDLLRPASRRLLVFPPSDPGKPLSEWIPVESFDSVGECIRARASQIAALVATDTDDIRISKSRCISLAEFQPSKKANVIVAATSLGPDPGGPLRQSIQRGADYSAERCGEIPGSGRQRDYLCEWRDSDNSGYTAANVRRVSWADPRVSRRERSMGRNGSSLVKGLS